MAFIERIQERSTINLIEVIEAIRDGHSQLINELSLGYVFQRLISDKIWNWAILSASRNPLSSLENHVLTERLEHDIRSINRGFWRFWLRGLEGSRDVKIGECPIDRMKLISETALLVTDISIRQALRFGDKYGQPKVICSFPGSVDRVLLLSSESRPIDAGLFDPDRLAEFYTNVRGRSFVFEELRLRPMGFFAGILKQVLLREHRSRSDRDQGLSERDVLNLWS